MKTLARILLVLCLLPGLLTGTLPLPGQAAGGEMVICADGGEQLVRIGPDGTPISHDDCQQCCLGCGPVLALSADVARPGAALDLVAVALATPAPQVAPTRPAHLFPAPRGPPLPV